MLLMIGFYLIIHFITFCWIETKNNNSNNFSISGIDVVRNKIKMFAQKKVTLPAGRHKIIILDEADRYLPIYLF